MKIKRKDKENKIKEKKDKVKIKLTKRQILTRILWAILIFSIVFAVYKNFTGIDKHTIHEKEVVVEKVYSTNKFENFVTDFAKIYYSWTADNNERSERLNKLGYYVTKDVLEITRQMIPDNFSTTSDVTGFRIWDVKEEKDNLYNVYYEVSQNINEGDKTTGITSYYMARVNEDKNGNLLIIDSPTVKNKPAKGVYVKKQGNDKKLGDRTKVKSIDKFLNTFFTVYPTITKDELAYYSNSKEIKPIHKRSFMFSEILNANYSISDKDDKIVKADFIVKYFDEESKSFVFSTYHLNLKKDKKWTIVN